MQNVNIFDNRTQEDLTNSNELSMYLKWEKSKNFITFGNATTHHQVHINKKVKYILYKYKLHNFLLDTPQLIQIHTLPKSKFNLLDGCESQTRIVKFIPDDELLPTKSIPLPFKGYRLGMIKNIFLYLGPQKSGKGEKGKEVFYVCRGPRPLGKSRAIGIENYSARKGHITKTLRTYSSFGSHMLAGSQAQIVRGSFEEIRGGNGVNMRGHIIN